MTTLRAADAFESAFRVAPVVACEVGDDGLGIYGWQTPAFEGFELPRHDDLVVALHRAGSRRVRQVTPDGLSSSRSIPGLITLLPPGLPAQFLTRGSVEVVTLHLPHQAATVQALAGLVEAGQACFALRDAYVSATMEALLRAARAEHELPPDYLPRLSQALLCHLEHWARTLSRIDPADAVPDRGQHLGRVPLRQLLAHVDEQLQRKLTIGELAAYCGLGRAQFCLAFQLATGTSPHRHLLRRRLSRAQRLLQHSGHDLAFIAQECGFSSQSHFTAQFRRFNGQTPARYRQRH